MTIHEHLAGREAVRFFLSGFPRLRTSADFRKGFREEAAIRIERLIGALDALDGDPDLEDAGDCEPSLTEAVSLRSRYRWDDGSEADYSNHEVDREFDVADSRHDADCDDLEPSEDDEISDMDAEL